MLVTENELTLKYRKHLTSEICQFLAISRNLENFALKKNVQVVPI
ncbi:MAG: hypothetical protein ACI90V_004972 [Bacillariaceae sp.]|jgi:hypothetical protein